MKKRLWTLISSVLVGIVAPSCDASPNQDGPEPAKAAARPAAAQQTAEVPATPVAGTLVTVNGDPVTQAEVAAMFTMVMENQTGGRPVPANMIAQMRERLHPQLVEALIDDRLLDAEIEAAGLSITREELTAEFERGLRGQLLQGGLTPEEFEANLQSNLSMSFDDFVNERSSSPTFKRSVLQTRMIEKKFPSEVEISDDEVKARYEQDRTTVYTRPTQVRASHILFPTDGATTDDAKAASREKAKGVRETAATPIADFAALARQHSSCPSKEQGGDLGFFPRQGAMVEPFAAAAYDLKVGEVSDVVETQFGFHVIKVTERKEGSVVSLDSASDAIRWQLRLEKVGETRNQHLATLRETAEIVYSSAERAPAPSGDGG